MAESEQEREAGIGDLMKEAIKDVQELVKIEIALAKQELRYDVTKLKSAAIAFGVAAAAAILTLAMLLVAIVIAVGGAAPALAIAAILLSITIIAAVFGYRLIPREPTLDRTKEHAETQAKLLKERIA